MAEPEATGHVGLCCGGARDAGEITTSLAQHSSVVTGLISIRASETQDEQFTTIQLAR